MGDFDELSDYDNTSGVSLVKIGYKKPVTEKEFNEMQEIPRFKHNDFVDVTLGGDGILNVGGTSYSGTTFTMSNEVAYVSGQKITIPSISFTVSEGESIYLDVYDEEVAHADTLYVNGQITGYPLASNWLLDSRIAVETSRRVSTRYTLVKTTGVSGHTYLLLGAITGGIFVKSVNTVGFCVYGADGFVPATKIHNETYNDFAYVCTGSDDGIAISDLVNAFMNKTGIWSGSTVTDVKFTIYGTPDFTTPYGAGTDGLTDPYLDISFNNTTTNDVRVTIDWSGATLPALVQISGSYVSRMRHKGFCNIHHKGLVFDLPYSAVDCFAVIVYPTTYYGTVKFTSCHITQSDATLDSLAIATLVIGGYTYIDKCTLVFPKFTTASLASYVYVSNSELINLYNSTTCFIANSFLDANSSDTLQIAVINYASLFLSNCRSYSIQHMNSYDLHINNCYLDVKATGNANCIDNQSTGNVYITNSYIKMYGTRDNQWYIGVSNTNNGNVYLDSTKIKVQSDIGPTSCNGYGVTNTGQGTVTINNCDIYASGYKFAAGVRIQEGVLKASNSTIVGVSSGTTVATSNYAHGISATSNAADSTQYEKIFLDRCTIRAYYNTTNSSGASWGLFETAASAYIYYCITGCIFNRVTKAGYTQSAIDVVIGSASHTPTYHISGNIFASPIITIADEEVMHTPVTNTTYFPQYANQFAHPTIPEDVATVDFYVNIATGDDYEVGTSSGTAFKTIAKAVSMLPKQVTKDYVIHISTGNYTSGYINIKDHYGSGSITISGSGSVTIVKSTTVSGCTCSVTFTDMTSDYIKAEYSNNAYFAYITTIKNMYFFQAQGRVSLCNITSATEAIQAVSNSYVTIYGNSGGSNTVVLSATLGSVIVKNGSVGMTGSTAESAATGGLIR